MGRGWSGVLLLLALGGASCAPAPKSPLVMGTVPWVGTEPLFLARELGLFPGPIHLVEYLNSEHLIRAFQNGVIDAAAVTVDEVLNLDRLGQQAQVVFVLDGSHGADCLMARPEVTTVAELRGRKVSSEDVMLPTYMLVRALEQAGLKLEDVQREYHALEAMEEALRRGEVDAVVGFEPFCHRMAAQGARRIFDSSQIPGEIVDVLVVRRSYLQAHPEQVDALLRGWLAALAVLQERPAEAARRMGPRVGLEGGAFLEALKGVRHPDLQEQRLQLMGERPRLYETVERLGSVMVREQALPALPDPRRLIDTAPLLRVAP
jgi:NitT/TauT family transport system substrate-binding protein